MRFLHFSVDNYNNFNNTTICLRLRSTNQGLESRHVFGGIGRHCVSSLDSKEWCHGGFSTALDISENNFPHRLILAQNLNI